MSKLLIKNGRYINPITNTDDILDVLIENDRIADVSKEINLSNGVKVINAENCWVTPGLIDIHCHLRDPGYPEKETIETGTRAASAGGFTSICPMANTNPVIDAGALVEYVNKTNQKYGFVNIFQIAAVTKGLNGTELTPQDELKNAGAIAFSDDGKPIENLKLYRHALEYAKMLDMTIISHAEDTHLKSDGVIHEGELSLKLGIPGIPSSSEEAAMAREIALIRQTKGKLHFAHVTTKEGVELLRLAKEEGLNITGEVAPHNLILIDEDLEDFNPNKKMNPPLRSRLDREALVKAVLGGIIEVLATDHAPHTREEKSVSIMEAPFGIIGFETALPLYLEVFYHSKKMKPLDFIKLITSNPARILNIPRGSISKGDVADITIINPEYEWTYDVTASYSKSKNSPFDQRKLKGKAMTTIVGGKIIFEASLDA